VKRKVSECSNPLAIENSDPVGQSGSVREVRTCSNRCWGHRGDN